MYVEADHLSDWIATGRVTVSSVELSREFDEFLCTLPWLPSRIDWRSIPYSVFDYAASGWSGEAAVQWARQNHLLEYDEGFLMYSASEPGLICRSSDIFMELDFLTLGRVHPAYICGVRQAGDGYHLSFERFAEWDGFSVLTTAV